MNMMTNYTNNTKEVYSSLIVEEIEIDDRVIAGILWILYMIPGNALMLGMVQFDRLGGDPLKRRIIDQVKLGNERIVLFLQASNHLGFFCSYFLTHFYFWSSTTAMKLYRSFK